MNRNPLDRSAAFTCLLELDPEGFGKQDMNTSGQTISRFLEDFHQSGQTRMYEYAQQWLPEESAQPGEAASKAQPGSKTQATADLTSRGQLVPPQASEGDFGRARAWESAPEAAGEGNPYQPFTPEHRVWEIAQSNPDLSGEELARQTGWVPHDGTLLRDDLIAQYRREAEPAAEAGSPAVEADGSYTNPETRYGLFILGDGQITEPEAG